jgi:hypothetical protein
MKKALSPTISAVIEQEKLSQKETLHAALSAMGHHFTSKLIAWSNDQKIKGFSQNAEDCLISVKAQRKSILWLSFWIILAFIPIEPKIISYIKALVLGFFAWQHYEINIRDAFNKPGKTAKMVAKTWKKARGVSIQTGIANDVARMINHSDDARQAATNWMFGHDSIEKWIVHFLDQGLKESAREVKEAEQKGFGGIRKKYRAKFAQIYELSQDLGFEPRPWEYYFGS